MYKRYLAFLLGAVLSFSGLTVVRAEPEKINFSVNAKAAVIMESSTGKVIYEQNPDERLAPASVTKVMTILLIYEAIEQEKVKWTDVVTVSEHAAGMGGSQVYLAPMEQQTVKELTKSIVIASGNDAAVAMAEFIGGTEEYFVGMMNKKAQELGMVNTHFENACGLDADNHYMSARDIAIMSRALISKYPQIQEFTTTWMDTIYHKTPKGIEEFGLTNTNRLVKWYEGTTGLKTGSTGKAFYCLSATAKRNDMELISVVMAAPTSEIRFGEAMKMFDFGFANFQLTRGDAAGTNFGTIKVYKGEKDEIGVVNKTHVTALTHKGNTAQLTTEVKILEGVSAPLGKGTKAGEIIYYYEGAEVGRSDLVTEEAVDKAKISDMFGKILDRWFN